MRKTLLLKYVANQADKKEQEEVLRWAEKRSENMDYLTSLKLAYMASEMPQERADIAEVASMRKTVELRSEHDSAIRSRNRYRIFSYISFAAAAIAVIAFILKPDSFTREEVRSALLQDIKDGRECIGLADMAQNSLQTVYTEKGVKSEIKLPDGSIVKLNSDTRITYPVAFAGATREVFMSGEAYFKVVGDSLRPMVVTTGKGSKIKVLGTEFNVKSYENDAVEQTTLYSGRIMLTSNKGEECKSVKPLEQVLVDAAEKTKIVKAVSVEDTRAWTHGRLVFDSTPMSEVVKILERWHGVEISVLNPKILNYKITANFESESIHQIMYIIKNVSLVDYSINGRNVSIFPR